MLAEENSLRENEQRREKGTAWTQFEGKKTIDKELNGCSEGRLHYLSRMNIPRGAGVSHCVSDGYPTHTCCDVLRYSGASAP